MENTIHIGISTQNLKILINSFILHIFTLVNINEYNCFFFLIDDGSKILKLVKSHTLIDIFILKVKYKVYLGYIF